MGTFFCPRLLSDFTHPHPHRQTLIFAQGVQNFGWVFFWALMRQIYPLFHRWNPDTLVVSQHWFHLLAALALRFSCQGLEHRCICDLNWMYGGDRSLIAHVSTWGRFHQIAVSSSLHHPRQLGRHHHTNFHFEDCWKLLDILWCTKFWDTLA